MLVSNGFFFHQAHHRAAGTPKPEPEPKPPAEEGTPKEPKERNDLFKSDEDGPGAGGGYSQAAGQDSVALSEEALKKEERRDSREEEPIYEIEGPGAGGGYLRPPDDEDADEVPEPPKNDEKE